MKKTGENLRGVIAVTNLARQINSEIGDYEEHFINENFGYSVRLSNKGAITMSSEIAQDYEVLPSSVTPQRVQQVANSFRKIP